MTTRVGNWLDERIGWRGIWQAIFLRKIPKVNWWFTLGSASLFVATVQVFTGILLTLYYVPTPDHAYDSVQYITTQIAGGWFIRGVHHWGASVMVVLVFLHMLRVIFYGAYKYPREVTWLTGVILLTRSNRFWFHRLSSSVGPKSLLGDYSGHTYCWHPSPYRRLDSGRRARQ